ncbi:MBL fold metallo-hydrolase [Micromonospora sp. M12]
MIFGKQKRRPSAAVPLLRPGAATTEAADELNIVWYGHASTLIEIEGRRVLLDPVWSDRCSPRTWSAPPAARATGTPRRAAPLDAILISHDHYDHLDMATVRALLAGQSAPFLVPLGVGAHLDRWGVPAERIIELDWSESHRVAGLEITATAAQHFSGRGLRRDGTLWSSWVVAGARRKVFYTGDSGYFDGYADIGAEHGPFDVTLMQIGAYDRAWPTIHMFPEEAVSAHLDLRVGCSCRCTGPRSTWPCTTGPSRSTGCGPRRRRATCGSPCPAPESGSWSTSRPPSTVGGRPSPEVRPSRRRFPPAAGPRRA